MFNLEKYKKQYYLEHKEYFKKKRHQRYLKNKDDENNKSQKWKLHNRFRVLKRAKEYRLENMEYYNKYQKEYHKTHGWYLCYYNAKRRCNNPNNDHFNRYGGRGIKLLMSLKDFKYLWFRDKAYNLKQPSIDRIDNDGNYELNNCRFIEYLENSKRKTINV